MYVIHLVNTGKIRFEQVFVTECGVVECRDTSNKIKLYLNSREWSRIEWTP